MNRFLTSLIAALTLTSLQAQTLQKAPRLVIVLTIDQLRTDYLDDFSSILGQDGFKKLWKEGRVYC
ncbi:MAG: alkaline phosphatase family protein, partial [Bacteroidaceae bacterium]